MRENHVARAFGQIRHIKLTWNSAIGGALNLMAIICVISMISGLLRVPMFNFEINTFRRPIIARKN